MKIWPLVVISLLGTVSMHVLVPALRLLGDAFHVEYGQAKNALTVYMIGLAFGQLLHGLCSDSIGRKQTLYVGLFCYLIGIFICLGAESFELFLWGRLIQGFGGSAGLTISRAVIKDESSPEKILGNLTALNLMVTLGPGLAPLVGGSLTQHWGWHSTLWFMLVFGLTALVIVSLTFRPRAAVRTRQHSYFHELVMLLRSGTFFAWVICGGVASASIYAFLSAASHLLHANYQRTPEQTGWIVAIIISGILLGNFLALRARTFTNDLRIIATLVFTAFCASLALYVMGVLRVASLHSTVALMLVYAVMCGMTAPTFLVNALSVFPGLSGTSAGLFGFGQMVVGILCTSATSGSGDIRLSAYLIMCAATAVSLLCIYSIKGATTIRLNEP